MNIRVRVLLGLGAVCRAVFDFEQPVDLADAGVDASHFKLDRAHGERIVARLQEVGGRDVLEIGCGLGGMLSVLSDSGARASGVDIDERRVMLARARGLDARVGDAEALPFADERFDLVVSHAVLEHITHIDAALLESRRVLRPGGIFWAAWGPSWPSYNGPHLIKCLSVPWVQYLFADRTIFAALKEQKRQGRWPASYLDYKMLDFQRMGRTSRRGLRSAAKRVGFEVVSETSRSPRPLKDLLGKVPPFNELVPGELTVVLRRPTAIT